MQKQSKTWPGVQYPLKIQLIWNKKPQGSKGLEDFYQWGNTSQNFVSAEPDTLDKADYIDWRLVQAINVGPILHSW